MALFNTHKGSWFGLPDFGITERFTGNRTTQGGSNVIGSAPRAQNKAVLPARTSSVTPQMAGQQQAFQNYINTQNQGLGVQSGGSSGGGGQPTPSGNQSNFSVNDVLQQEPQAPQIDFDALIAPALQGLEEAIAPMQQEFASAQTGIEAGKTSKTAKAKQELGEQEAVIGQARTGQTQQAESAIDEARRQFGELQQGIQSRYGGTTGTGRFAAEIAGGQTFRNIANIRQNLSQVMAGLDDKLVQVKEIGRIALQDIQDQGDQQVRDAKNRLDTALADIRRQKGELQSRRAELASNAIQWYQGEVNRVKQQNAQFLQDLYTRQQTAEQQLQLAMQKAKSVTGNLGTVDYSQYVGENNPLIQAGFSPTVTQRAPGGVSVSYSQKEDTLEEKLKKAAATLGGGK